MLFVMDDRGAALAAAATDALRRELREAMVGTVAFGSYARGEYGRDSDLHLPLPPVRRLARDQEDAPALTPEIAWRRHAALDVPAQA